MSRLRRLKENRRKNTIKTTMASLALVLAIGSTQTMGTYSLFTDVEDVPSDLSISTGDVDVKVGEGLDFTDVQPGEKREIPVTITNQGTLNQNISLNLLIADEIKKYLTYDFVFDGIIIKDGIMYENTELFVLPPGQTKKGNIVINIKDMNPDQQNDLYNRGNQKISLEVKSKQIDPNNKVSNYGFYDIEIQENSLAIGEYIKNVLTGMIKVTGNTVTIEFKDVPELTQNLRNISVVNSTGIGEFEGAYTKIANSNKLEIEFKSPHKFELDKVGEEFDNAHKVQIRFEYKDDTNAIYEFDFRKAKIPENHSHLDAKYELIQRSITGLNKIQEETEVIKPEVVETTNEGMEEQSNPEIVESSKEEVVEQSKPEVIEPSKDEIVIPSKTDIIAPPKEEIEIQE